MSGKEKIIRPVYSRRQGIIVIAPILIATIIVFFRLVNQSELAYFSDAYTTAVIFSLLIVALFGFSLRTEG